MPEIRRHYDREFKAGAVRIVQETRRPIAEVEVRRFTRRFLHGKAYLFGDAGDARAALVTSANLTGAGLFSNLELGLVQYDPRQDRDRPGAHRGVLACPETVVRPGYVPPAGEVDLLLSNDVLSEGQNLQQAAAVISYDMPRPAPSR